MDQASKQFCHGFHWIPISDETGDGSKAVDKIKMAVLAKLQNIFPDAKLVEDLFIHYCAKHKYICILLGRQWTQHCAFKDPVTNEEYFDFCATTNLTI